MHDNIKEQFYNMLTGALSNVEMLDESTLDYYIKQFVSIPLFSNVLKDRDIRDIRNKITSEREIKLEMGSLIQVDYAYKKWFLNKKSELDMKYWERYKKYLMYDKGFPSTVVNTMDDVLDTLTDLLGDPTIDGTFQRRGLIMGDVQSGKTANYTGLICKGVDAGYKIVVLLTGTIEKLRKQTQLRLDEGFAGIDSDAMIKKNVLITGVGKYDKTIKPIVLTSKERDFKAQTARSVVGLDLKSQAQPVMFVIKKNVSTLKHLNKWLKTFNQNGDNSIDNSLLVVDDESDNASVNTNPEDRDPTAINAQIRELLNSFSRASYVGFTATPFANIFIDPETDDTMLKEDLFPKDYIYSLNAPSDYIGARDIFNKNGKYNKTMLEVIDYEEIHELLPISHKGDFSVSGIPNDLKEAICTFLLANVIRDLRGDTTAHRSMLINMSRLSNIQNQLKIYVNTYLKEIQSAVNVFSKLDENQALKNKYILDLYKEFKKYYSDKGYEWKEIQLSLRKSISPVTVVVVNKDNQNTLNYEDYEETGLRVIAIGGLSLSRGLTLEGLIVSYLYRNSKMYDTLMQMGRWFGYRKNYDDLCKIWMTEESISWYEHISEATDELRADIKRYENTGYTPMEFGLRVRSDINTLLVTARNKMRTASSLKISVTLSGEVIETPDIFADIDKNISNRKAVERLIRDIKDNERQDFIKNKKNKTNNGDDRSTCVYKNVKLDKIMNLLSDIEVPISNSLFNTESIRNFLHGYKGNELKEWDVAFVSGRSDRNYSFENVNINLIQRSFAFKNSNKILRMGGAQNRIGGPEHGKLGLSVEQINKYNCTSQKQWFKQIERNPLLIIYMVDPYDSKLDKEKSEQIKKIYEDRKEPLIGFSIGIPQLGDKESKYINYTTNKIHQLLNMDDSYDETYDIGDDE